MNQAVKTHLPPYPDNKMQTSLSMLLTSAPHTPDAFAQAALLATVDPVPSVADVPTSQPDPVDADPSTLLEKCNARVTQLRLSRHYS